MFRSLSVSGLLVLSLATLTHAQNQGGQQQNATVVQLPSQGVAINARGVLSLISVADPGGRLRAARTRAARQALPMSVVKPSKLRKISLVRLENEIRKRLDAGLPLTDEILNLAGLHRLQYVFFYPQENDIVIAGPAEGWVQDPAGRTVGMTTFRPIVKLEDLLVALRAYGPGRRSPKLVGCSIDATGEGLQRLRKFQQTIPRTIPDRLRGQVARRIATGTQRALGMARIRVFGISPRSRAAQVLIEADYRMKLMAIGLERPPLKMATYIGKLRRAPKNMLQRWWFTPQYDAVKVSPSRLAMELVGQGVQLNTEDIDIGNKGGLGKARKPSAASAAFSKSFTRLYPNIAALRPVYAQMRNIVDLLVAAAFIQQQRWYSKAGWSMPLLSDERRLLTERFPVPKEAPCVSNAVWKGSRFFAPAGGGVAIQPGRAISAKQLAVGEDRNQRVIASHQRARLYQPKDSKRWWWD